MVGVDLDDLGVFRPVVHAVLGQGAKRAQARTQGDDNVGLRHELHARFAALVAQGAAPLQVAGREAVVVLVAVDHRATQAFGQGDALGITIGHHHAAAADEHGVLGRLEQGHRRLQAVNATGTPVQAHGLGDLASDLAIEQVTWNVKLGGPQLRVGAVKAACRELGHALVVVHVPLVLGEFLEHGQLVGFLKTAQALAHGAGLWRDDDHGAVRPISRGDGRDAVADAGAVLPDDHTVAAAGTRKPVGHVAGTLFVHHRDEANACWRKNVHGVHEGAAHDAEHLRHALRDQGLDKGFRRRHLDHAADDTAGSDGLGFVHGGVLVVKLKGAMIARHSIFRNLAYRYVRSCTAIWVRFAPHAQNHRHRSCRLKRGQNKARHDRCRHARY